MNVTNLVLQIKSKITDKTLDQQMVSKAIKLLELGAVESVTLFSDLPPAMENVGRLFYVEYDGLYWSAGDDWYPFALE
jgi:hypothetical protein